MILRFELFICHSDRTWSDCHFYEIDTDKIHSPADMEEEVVDRFLEENQAMDICHIGVINSEEIEDNAPPP